MDYKNLLIRAIIAIIFIGFYSKNAIFFAPPPDRAKYNKVLILIPSNKKRDLKLRVFLHSSSFLQPKNEEEGGGERRGDATYNI